MDFTHSVAANKGKTATRLVIVVAFHVALVVALIHSLAHTKIIPLPKIVDMVIFETPKIEEPPPPPIPKPAPKVPVKLDVVVPVAEVKVDPPPESVVVATTVVDPAPVAVDPGPPAVVPGTDKKGMQSAVLADANACQKPGYPAAAQRNGDTGTTVLALLVGTDGRVADAKIQKSSGSRDLDKAARGALSLCQFKAAMNDGVPQQAWASISYVWSLD